MKVEDIRKHARAIARITDKQARVLEIEHRANLIAKTVTPEYAEKLMKYDDLVELLDYVWTVGTRNRLQKKRTLNEHPLGA